MERLRVVLRVWRGTGLAGVVGAGLAGVVGTGLAGVVGAGLAGVVGAGLAGVVQQRVRRRRRCRRPG
jgi:hypothetical protein